MISWGRQSIHRFDLQPPRPIALVAQALTQTGGRAGSDRSSRGWLGVFTRSVTARCRHLTAGPAPSTGSRRLPHDHSGYRETLRGRQDAVKLLYGEFYAGQNLGRHPTGRRVRACACSLADQHGMSRPSRFPPADGGGGAMRERMRFPSPADEGEAGMA